MYYLTSNEWIHKIFWKQRQKRLSWLKWWCAGYTYNEIWDKVKNTLNIKFHSVPVYDEKYRKARVREFNGVINTNFLGDEIKRKCSLHLHSLYNYWFCYENGKKKLSTSLFRRVQIQIKENKDDQIHKHWIRVRFRVRVRIWHWIRVKAWVRTWFWMIDFLLFIAYVLNRQMAASWMACLQIIVILLTFGKSKNLILSFLLWASPKM